MKQADRTSDAGRPQKGASPAGLGSLVLEAARGQGLVQDLLEAFGNDPEKTRGVLALAFSACMEEGSFGRPPQWQDGLLAPGTGDRASASAAGFLADMPSDAAERFLALRRERHQGGTFLAGLSLPAPQDGQNGGRTGIVYALPAMEPVHGMAFPEGADCLDDAAALSREAEALGMPLKATVFGKEPGHPGLYRDLLEAGRPFVAFADPADYPAYRRIRDDVVLARSGEPSNMDFDLETRRFMAQFDIPDTSYRAPDGEWKIAEDYVCSLSLDLAERGRILTDLKCEERLAERFAMDKSARRTQADLDAMNQRLRHCSLCFGEPPYGKRGEVLVMCHGERLRHAAASAGFAAAAAWKVPAPPGEILRAVQIRDGQERFFQRLQERAAGLASGLAGAEEQARFAQGLRFAGFAGFILQALARRLWEGSEELRDAFASPEEALRASGAFPPPGGLSGRGEAE